MMSTVSVYVGLGSNDPHALAFLARAREALAGIEGHELAQCSPLYTTEPQEYSDQPWFWNQVLRLQVQEECWTACSLMRAFLETETRLGRVRSPDPALRFGPRCIDIDMLLFGDLVSADPVCIVPHPRLVRRAFWLVPLRDLTPSLLIHGEPVEVHLSRLAWHAEGNKIFQ